MEIKSKTGHTYYADYQIEVHGKNWVTKKFDYYDIYQCPECDHKYCNHKGAVTESGENSPGRGAEIRIKVYASCGHCGCSFVRRLRML
jgi:hypothetical protein